MKESDVLGGFAGLRPWFLRPPKVTFERFGNWWKWAIADSAPRRFVIRDELENEICEVSDKYASLIHAAPMMANDLRYIVEVCKAKGLTAQEKLNWIVETARKW